MEQTTFRRIVRASALYDLVVTAPFATPWTFALAYGHLQALNGTLGGAPLPPFAPLHVLFACLLGSLVLVWAVLRVHDPRPRFGGYDGAGRFLFTAWMAWALAVSDAAAVALHRAGSAVGHRPVAAAAPRLSDRMLCWRFPD